MSLQGEALACLCGSQAFIGRHLFLRPPPPERQYQFSAAASYRRELVQCRYCGHYRSVHGMDASSLYAGDYVTSTYGDGQGMLAAFQRIIALPVGQSDNQGRVRRLLQLAETLFLSATAPRREAPTILDVGSGLCVFLHLMKQAGWGCTALDTDPRQARHAEEVVGVKAVCGRFSAEAPLGLYDVITFNKVLEHVRDPIAMLQGSHRFLAPGGFIYLEVPDGEMAFQDTPDREEFTIDHLHIFSAASLAILADRAGFVVKRLERLREPSSKYTLWACLTA